MSQIVSWLLDASVVVFAITSMLSVGCAYTFGQVLAPLRNLRWVLRALLANFVLVPLFALLVLRLLPLPEPHETGIFLIAAAAGAPFLVMLAQAAESDVALSATLLVLLLPATIVYMPVVVPLALPEAHVKALAIAVPLVLTMLLPLAVGFVIRDRSERWAMRLQPSIGKVAIVALVVLIVDTTLSNLHEILDVLGTTAILAALLVIGGAFVIGYLLGTDRASSEVLGFGTSQRNVAAATVVAATAVDDPDAVVMVIVASLAGLALLFPVAAWFRKRAQQHERRSTWRRTGGRIS